MASCSDAFTVGAEEKRGHIKHGKKRRGFISLAKVIAVPRYRYLVVAGWDPRKKVLRF
jgi:hypothetical protein